nr:immunoglobulin light chain junction region [Macaca mulatta]MOX50018.1 immunoglobulin light chain junction region [Macaca mulatta]
CGQGTQLPWSF